MCTRCVGAALFIGGLGTGATNLRSSLLVTLSNTTDFADNVVDQVVNIKQTLIQVQTDVKANIADTSFIDAVRCLFTFGNEFPPPPFSLTDASIHPPCCV